MSRAAMLAAATGEARAFLDRIHLLPRVCRSAVDELCGDSWGSARVDHSPLFVAVVAAVTSLELNCVEHPEDVVIDLLNDCVQKAKEAASWCGHGLVRNMDPAAYLAVLLNGMVAVFDMRYMEDCAEQEAQALRQSEA